MLIWVPTEQCLLEYKKQDIIQENIPSLELRNSRNIPSVFHKDLLFKLKSTLTTKCLRQIFYFKLILKHFFLHDMVSFINQKKEKATSTLNVHSTYKYFCL